MNEYNLSKNRSPDRILVLKPMEGKTPLNSIGSADPRLFTGENRMHAKMEQETSFWKLEYDSGQLPEALKQRFTSFNRLLQFVTEYYKRRNVDITEVIN